MKKLIIASVISMMAINAFAAKTIKIAHGSTPDFHMHKAMEKFKEEVESQSNGDLLVEIYPSGQIAGDTGMVEAAQAGTVQMAVEPPSFMAKWDPAFEIPELPFIYPSKEVAFKVLNSEVGKSLLAKTEEYGLKGLGWMEMGERHLTNNVRPINDPEDLAGIKLRTMKVPTHIMAFEALGAKPTPMNFSEVYSALQMGVIDGQENPISQIYTQKFNEVQKYISLDGHVLALYMPVMNIDFYNNLSDEEKNIVNQAMADAIEYDKTLVNDLDKQYLEEMQSQGMEVNKLTPEQKQKFKDGLNSAKEAIRNRVGPELYDEWMGEIDKNS